MKNIERAKGIIKKAVKTPSFYFCLLFIVLNLFFTKIAMNESGVSGFVLVAIFEVVLECSCIYILFRMRKKGKPIEKQFLFLALVIGTLFIVLLPPGQAPDDKNHFRRAYGISEGAFIPEVVDEKIGGTGSWLPNHLLDGIEELPQKDTYERILGEIGSRNDDGYKKDMYANTSLYSFICYIPQILAIMVGKIFSFSFVGMMYLAKIFNFVLWTILVYFAIKLIPKFKAIVVFVALLPITMQEATSLAPDALTIGLSFFLIGYVLNLICERKDILKKRELVLISCVSLVIGFCKIVYLPLVFLLLAIPYERFGSKKLKWWFLGILLAVVVGLNLVWLSISSNYLVEFNPGVDSKAQLGNIISHPLGYLYVIINSFGAYSNYWLSSMMGMSLGSFSFNLPELYFFILLGMFILLLAQRNESLDIDKKVKWFFALIFAGIMLLIFTSLYIQWTPVNHETIEGVQGRYFLPILLLIPVVLSKNVKKTQRAVLVPEKTILNCGLFVNVLALAIIFAQNI